MATDQAWLDEFTRGLIRPQPVVYPTVRDAAELRLRQIQRQIDELQREERMLRARIANH